ncbi:MAG: methyltransferase family protein [Rhodomicrobium sp.]
MTDLDEKAFRGLLWLLATMAALIFIPAGTLAYWQAWLFLTLYFALTFAITLYLMKFDRALLARRLRGGPGAETEKTQKIVMALAMAGFIALIVVSALDRRFHWSSVPPFFVLAGDALVALGFFVIFLVFRENSFSSGTIEIAPDQEVISTGPYAHVRHPMYSGGLLMLCGIPLALGSWRGLLVMIPLVPVLLWRLFDEEKFLAINLPGYVEYGAKVRYRLLPFFW